MKGEIAQDIYSQQKCNFLSNNCVLYAVFIGFMGLRIFKYFYCISLLLLLLPMASNAQSDAWSGANSGAQKTTDTKHKLKDFKEHLQNWGLDTNYNHAFLIGGKLNSDGWSASIYFVKRKSYKLNNFWQINFSEIKHDKQTKQTGSNDGFMQLGTPTPYVFGKINNLYTLQIGFGKEKLLLPSVFEGNLSVSYRFSGGFSLATLKPYYLKLVYVDYTATPETAHTEQHKYSITDTAQFLNTSYILGASNWSKGLDEIDYVPGAYFETAIAITPGKNKTFIQVITLGVNAAYYVKSLPIMADQKAYPYKVSLFAGLAIGKRWK